MVIETPAAEARLRIYRGCCAADHLLASDETTRELVIRKLLF